MASHPALSSSYIEEYSGGKLIAVAVAFVPILIFFVSVRFYSRYLSKTPLGLDDLLVVLSLGLQLGSSALTICFVRYGGVGRHFAAWEQIDPGKTVIYFKYLLAVSFCYFFFVAWPKLAILALYLRLFTLKRYRIIIYILAGIVATTGIVCAVMSLSLCHPFEFNWDRTISGGTCVNEQAFYRWGSLPNIVTDIAMLVLPLPIVWNLHTSFKLKLGLTVAFTTGSLGLATSILRFTSFFHGNAIQDGTWSSVNLMIWTVVEPDVYLIAACLLTFRPVLIHLLQRTRLISKALKARYRSGRVSDHTLSIRADPNIHYHHTAGINHLEEGKSSIDAHSYGDHINLVQVLGDSDIRGRHDLSANNIHVQNEYDVTVSRV